MRIESLDHVALWVADRDALERFLVESFPMHRIERTERFTLVGADARAGKLTLFEGEGPRDPGALAEVGFSVPDLEAAVVNLESTVANGDTGVVRVDAPEGLRLALVERPGAAEYDLTHVTLRVSDPYAAQRALASLGFDVAEGRLRVGDTDLLLVEGDVEASERPLLNHLGLKVGSAEAHLAEARERGLEVEDVVDAPNTLAVFVRGPDRLRLEYVEHKPSFSLR